MEPYNELLIGLFYAYYDARDNKRNTANALKFEQYYEESRDFLKARIPRIRAFLREELQLELHPRKIYLQHYTRGVQYLGAYLKPHRSYISPRVKNNFYQAVQAWNRYIQQNGNKIEGKALKAFIGSMNSYLGILKHHNTYKLRKKLLGQLNGYFWNHVYVSGGYGKLVPKKRRVKRR